MSVTRRSFLNIAPLALAPALWPSVADARRETHPRRGGPSGPPAVATAPPDVPASFPTQPPELAMEIVGASHSNIARVKELLAAHPTLARASWDWGFGDWEDALGAASHVGNREIAALLLANGARPTIFSAAMLGQLDVVKAFIAASPGIEATPGPHSIPLLAHALAGGPAAQPVADYLKSLPGANKRPDTQPITPEQMKALAGDYVFGAGPTEKITIAVNANNILTFTRTGRSARNLFHVGDLAFYPVGAPLVRVRFVVSATTRTLRVHDPEVVLEAVAGPLLGQRSEGRGQR
jgi:hypothetical protein